MAAAGLMLLAGPALERTTGGSPLLAAASAATCAADCASPSPHSSLLAEIGGWVAEALLSTPARPTYDDLWISKEKLQHLARYHGTHALKITGTKVYVRRGKKWIAVTPL